MSANQQNPATVAQLSAHEGNQQEFYYPPQALAENSNIMAYAREKGFANVERAIRLEHPEPRAVLERDGHALLRLVPALGAGAG